jgi:hypothetical protein
MKIIVILFAVLLSSTCITGIAAAQTTTLLPQGGLGLSCNAVTAATAINPGLAGGCTSLALVTSGGALPGNYTWQTITTGSPASVSVTLVGSLDNVTWITLDTNTSTTGGSRVLSNASAYRFLGCVPGTLSGGSSPTLTCQISVTSTASGGGGGGGGNVSTNPAGSQAIVQPVSGGSTTIFSANNFAGTRVVASSWNWFQNPSDDLSVAGSKTIHLAPCPAGIDVSGNTNHQYSVYISAGTGTAEAVPVTGGTCTSGGASGTIVVTTANSHTGAYAVGSASTGLAEAVNDSGTWNNHIYLMPATGAGNPNYPVQATVYFDINHSVITGDGAVVKCFTRNVCLFNGDQAGLTGQYNEYDNLEMLSGTNVDGALITSASSTANVTTVTTASNHNLVNGDYVIIWGSNTNALIRGKRVVTVIDATNFTMPITQADYASSTTYGWVAIENAAIEDESNGMRIHGLKIPAAGGGNLFHWGVLYGNDQHFKIDGITNEGAGSVIRCNANFCGAMIYGRGDQGAAPFGVIENAELSMQCTGNGIRWESGNGLHVRNSVIQGFNQYGVYYAGGLIGWTVDGVYQETGASCNNPFYPGPIPAQVGLLNGSGKDLTYYTTDPIGGTFPSFAAQNSGGQQNNYYVVILNGVTNMGMYYIGSCLTTGAGNCSLAWPEPILGGLGTITYDVLVTVGASTNPPVGTGTFAVATGVSPTLSNAGIATFTDTQGARSGYTVNSLSQSPTFSFWPGAIVLSGGTHMYAPFCGQAAGIITTTYLPAVFCQRYINSGGNPGQYTPFWAVAQEGDSGGNANTAVGGILQQIGGATGAPPTNLTGKLGFLSMGGQVSQSDYITLAYTNPFNVISTPGYRIAPNNADAAIGFDNTGTPVNAQLGLRAGHAIDFYVNHTFDNSSFLAQLTASTFTLNVPLVIPAATNSPGFWGGTYYPNIFGADGANVLIGANNQLRAIQMVMPATQTVNEVTVDVTTGVAASTYDFCIYSATGTTLLASTGGFSTASTAITKKALTGSVTLNANTLYWFAWTGTDSTVQFENQLPSAAFSSTFNGGSTARMGTSGTASSGGVCPSSLGTITGAQIRIPLAFFDK